MRHYLVSLILIINFVLLQDTKPVPLSFQYGILCKKDFNSNLEALEDSSSVYTDSQLKINVLAKKNTYFHLIYHGADGSIMTLDMEQDQSAKESDIWSTSFLELGPPTGIENLYLINATTSQSQVLKVVRGIETSAGAKQAKYKKMFFSLINKMLNNNSGRSSLQATRLETPIQGGVSFRGEDDEQKINIFSMTHQSPEMDNVSAVRISLVHQ